MTLSPTCLPRDVDRLRFREPFDPNRPPSTLSFILRDFTARWDRLRAGRRAPARADFRPEDFSGHLGNIVLIDCLTDRRFRLRLIGSLIVQCSGREATGLTYEQAYAGESLERITEVARCVRDDWCGMHVRATMELGAPRRLGYEAVIMPLSSDRTDVDMLIMRMDFRNATRIN